MLKRIFANPFIFFPLLTLVVFWPISLSIFTFKNDALSFYYPVKTLISDALNNFELPLWTPFINMGYPLHADMQSGAWNPVVWIFSFITGYGLAGFHYEILSYFAFAGIGFYYLCKDYGYSKSTALTIGVAYELSGFMIASSQFATCISSACYIPFILLFFKRLLANKKALDALLTALFLYLLFTGGYPSLFIITAYVLVAQLIFTFFSTDKKIFFIKKITGPGLLSLLVFTLLSLPAIISYVQHLPLIERGKTQGLSFVLENSLPPGCMFSLISPFSTTANSAFFNTDPLMRNSYAGLIPFTFLTVAVFTKSINKNKEVLFFLFAALVLFGMAWGNHFFLRQMAYYTLPLMDTFRHPAFIRLFGIIFLLLASGFAMNEWEANCKTAILKKTIITIGAVALLVGIWAIFFYKGKGFVFKVANIKLLLREADFRQRYFIQLPFIIATLTCFYFIISKRKNSHFILWLSIADLFFATQLNVPFTVIGAKPFNEVTKLINRNMVKFPLPKNESIEYNSANTLDSSKSIGSTLLYEKRIGRNDFYITPGNLSLQEFFYESTIRKMVFKNPVVYFADTIITAYSNLVYDSFTKKAVAFINTPINRVYTTPQVGNKINIYSLTANSFSCTIEKKAPGLVVFLQNNYPGWKAFIDEKEVPIVTTNITFMGVLVAEGKHQLLFKYHPSLIVFTWYIAMFTLAGILAFLLLIYLRRINFFNKHQ